MKSLSRQEIQEQYNKGKRNFGNLDLEGQDLIGITLLNANLTGSNFKNCNLRFARLNGANLSESNLENAKFKMAELGNVNFSFANLKKSDFTYLRLYGVNFEGADLEDAVFTTTTLIEANFECAILANANLVKANLYKAIFRDANLTGANLSEANLEEADLTGANLDRTIFYKVCWIKTKLDSPEILPDKEKLAWKIANKAKIGKNLNELDLSNLDLSDLNLRQANLQNSNLSNCIITNSLLMLANLSNSNLTNTNLSGTNIGGANFTNADLSNADLSDIPYNSAKFNKANLENISYQNTSFFYADIVGAINTPKTILSSSLIPSNNPNYQLIQDIRDKAKGLVCGVTKSHPYEVFLWNVADKGEFNIYQLFKDMAYIKKINLNSLYNSNNTYTKELAKTYQALFDSIQQYLIDIKVYEFRTEAITNSSYVIPIILVAKIAKTNDWLCISTAMNDDFSVYIPTDKKHDIQDLAINKSDNKDVITNLEIALEQVNRLLPETEVTQTLVWSLAENKNIAFQNTLIATKHFAVDDFKYTEYFFTYNLSDLSQESEKDIQITKFADQVINNLCNIRVYLIGQGDGNMDFYLMGQGDNQDWIGIRTEVTWC